MLINENELIEEGLLDAIKGVFGKAFGALTKSISGAVNKAMGSVEGFLKDGERKWSREFSKSLNLDEDINLDNLDPDKPQDRVVILHAFMAMLKDSSEQIVKNLDVAKQIDEIPADEKADTWNVYQEHVAAWVAVKGLLNFYIKRLKLPMKLQFGFEKDAPEDPASAAEGIIKELESAIDTTPDEFALAVKNANKEKEGSFDEGEMKSASDEAVNAARGAIQSAKEFGEKIAELMKDVEGVQESAIKFGLLRMVIKEEIGRNYHTLDTDPYTWKDYSDVDVQTYVNAEDGTYSAKVNCISDPGLSTNERKFEDEASAQHWARQQAERIFRRTLNKPREQEEMFSENILRAVIRELLNS